jgi:hypothetical protein
MRNLVVLAVVAPTAALALASPAQAAEVDGVGLPLYIECDNAVIDDGAITVGNTM